MLFEYFSYAEHIDHPYGIGPAQVVEKSRIPIEVAAYPQTIRPMLSASAVYKGYRSCADILNG